MGGIGREGRACLVEGGGGGGGTRRGLCRVLGWGSLVE